MKTVDFLDAVKKRHGLTSDYQLAKLLRWNTQRISMYRHTPRELDDDACVQIAEALGVPPAYVMACIAAARAKSADIKRHWLAAARLLKTGTAAVILATAVAVSQVAAPRAEASAARLTEPSIHYAPRRRRAVAGRTRPRRRHKTRTVIVAAANLPVLGNALAG